MVKLTKYDFAPDWLLQDANYARYLIKEDKWVDMMACVVAGDNFDADVFDAAYDLMAVKGLGEKTAAEIIFKIFLAVAGARQVDEVF